MRGATAERLHDMADRVGDFGLAYITPQHLRLIADELDQLYKALGEQTEAVRKWRNREHSQRSKRKKAEARR